MAGRLQDKVALISGAASGIGQASARLFCAEGAKVVFIDYNRANGEKTAAKISGAGGEIRFVFGDVRKEEDLRRAVDTALTAYGRIDVLFNNVGVTTACKHNLMDMDVETDYSFVMDTNIKSYLYLTRMVIPQMLRNGGGSIINTASREAVSGQPRNTPYSMSKGAVVQFTKHIAAEYARDNIRCNAILPGATLTGMVTKGSPTEITYSRLLPLGRMAEASEQAAAALFFASDECPYCTGCCLVIDGAASNTDFLPKPPQ